MVWTMYDVDHIWCGPYMVWTIAHTAAILGKAAPSNLTPTKAAPSNLIPSNAARRRLLQVAKILLLQETLLLQEILLLQERGSLSKRVGLGEEDSHSSRAVRWDFGPLLFLAFGQGIFASNSMPPRLVLRTFAAHYDYIACVMDVC